MSRSRPRSAPASWRAASTTRPERRPVAARLVDSKEPALLGRMPRHGRTSRRPRPTPRRDLAGADLRDGVHLRLLGSDPGLHHHVLDKAALPAEQVSAVSLRLLRAVPAVV